MDAWLQCQVPGLECAFLLEEILYKSPGKLLKSSHDAVEGSFGADFASGVPFSLCDVGCIMAILKFTCAPLDKSGVLAPPCQPQQQPLAIWST